MYEQEITKFKKLKKLFIILGSIALAFGAILLLVGIIVYAQAFSELMYLVQENPSKYYDSSTQTVIMENIPVYIIQNIGTGVGCLTFGGIFVVPGVVLLVLAFVLWNRKVKNYTKLQNENKNVIDAK